MIEKDKLLKQIENKDDRIFISNLYDKYKKYCSSGKFISSKFINEYQESLVKMYFPDLNIYKVNQLCSKSIVSSDADIDILMITPASGIKHRDVLGSLFSLGLEHDMIGDIFIEDSCIYLTSLKKMSKFLIDNLTSIKNVNVEINIVDKMNLVSTHLEIINLFVTSMRLDTVVSSLAYVSRSKGVSLINSGMVMVNYKVVNQIVTVKFDDIISIRGVGKFKIGNAVLETKKNKKKLEVYKYV